MAIKGREQRQAVAEQWSRYVRAEAARRRMTQADVVRASDGKISSGTTAKWWTAANTATPELALAFARALRLDPAEALQHAGYAMFAQELLDARAGNPARAPEPGDRHLKLIRGSGLPERAQRAAEEYWRDTEAAQEANLERYLEYLRVGEKLRSADEQPNGSNDRTGS